MPEVVLGQSNEGMIVVLYQMCSYFIIGEPVFGVSYWVCRVDIWVSMKLIVVKSFMRNRVSEVKVVVFNGQREWENMYVLSSPK